MDRHGSVAVPIDAPPIRETFWSMKRCGLYVRCSTDHQTVENQITILTEVAERSGWTIVRVFEDQGISGAKGRDKRPGFDALLKAIHRREIDMAAAFAVDRLGRSLTDLVAFLNDIQASGCDLYLHQQAVDTSSPSGRMMFGLLAVFSEFERALIRSRVISGIERARAKRRRVRSAQFVARPCGEGREGPEGRSEHQGGSANDRHLDGLRPAHQTLHAHGQRRPSGERFLLTSGTVVRGRSRR